MQVSGCRRRLTAARGRRPHEHATGSNYNTCGGALGRRGASDYGRATPSLRQRRAAAPSPACTGGPLAASQGGSFQCRRGVNSGCRLTVEVHGPRRAACRAAVSTRTRPAQPVSSAARSRGQPAIALSLAIRPAQGPPAPHSAPARLFPRPGSRWERDATRRE